MNTPTPQARHAARALFRFSCILVSILCFYAAGLRAAPTAMDELGLCIKPQSSADPMAYCDRVIASGAKWVRMGIEWSSIETARGVYDFEVLTESDLIVDRLRAGNVQIVWVLGFTAPWASSQPGKSWPDVTRHKPADWTDWENFVSFIANRYHGKITHWEVWNEPDHPGFWKDSVSDYATLLQKAHAKVKAIDPANIVLMGGLAMTNGTGDSYGPGTFLDQLLALDASASFDVVNYHAYGNYARHVALHSGMVSVINLHGIQAKPMWITETGYTTVGDVSLESMKADMVDQIALGNLRWDDVYRAFFYCYHNPVLTPSNPSEENFGLTDNSLNPLTAWWHYQAMEGAETDFARQAAYPALTDTVNTLYYFPAVTGDGSFVTAALAIPSGKYMYFPVDDPWIYDSNGGTDTSVDIEVTYLDAGGGNFALQYDAISSAYKSVAITRGNTNQWVTATLHLADAKFANRQNNRSDLRIMAGAAPDLIVSKVVARKASNSDTVILRYFSAHVGDGSFVTQSRVIPTGKYMYFRLNDGWIYDANDGIDSTLSVEVTYLDSGTGPLTLQYDGADSAYKVAPAITRQNTLLWKTATFTLADAKFANRQNNAADFRVCAGGGDLTVRTVAVRRVCNPASIILKGTPAFKLIEHVRDDVSTHEAYNPTVTRGGLECRSITADNRYFYFRVSDAFARSGDIHISVTVTFWDEGTDRFVLQYNAVGNPYKVASIVKTGTNLWRTVTVDLADADLDNTQNYGADFRIGNGWDGGPEYLRRVDVTIND